jgi:hypothetical protein
MPEIFYLAKPFGVPAIVLALGFGLVTLVSLASWVDFAGLLRPPCSQSCQQSEPLLA